MNQIPFLNSLDNLSSNSFINLVNNDSFLIKALGSQKQHGFGDKKILWFESPYGYSHLKKNKLKNYKNSFCNKSIDQKLQSDLLSCIFIRPSICNLLDMELKMILKEKNFSLIDSGNQIFYLSKENLNNSSIEKLISKKRIAKIKKGEKLNTLLKCDTNYLIQNNLFIKLKKIYFESMKRKSASKLYYFENLWNLPTTFNLANSLFYLALDNFTKEILSFLIVIGDIEQNIFLSASTIKGLKKESASFLRFYAIQDYLISKEAKILNMGGVDKKKGGDESFKKSFGGFTLDYKLIFKMNKKLYNDHLKKFNVEYNENNLRFWL